MSPAPAEMTEIVQCWKDWKGSAQLDTHGKSISRKRWQLVRCIVGVPLVQLRTWKHKSVVEFAHTAGWRPEERLSRLPPQENHCTPSCQLTDYQDLQLMYGSMVS